MDLALSFIVAVAAGVVCHYIIKWLDGDKQPVTSLWIQTFPHKNQEQKNPRMALRGFFVAVHYGIALSFCLLALQHTHFCASSIPEYQIQQYTGSCQKYNWQDTHFVIHLGKIPKCITKHLVNWAKHAIYKYSILIIYMSIYE